MLGSLGDFLDEIFQTPVGKPAGQLARQSADVWYCFGSADASK